MNASLSQNSSFEHKLRDDSVLEDQPPRLFLEGDPHCGLFQHLEFQGINNRSAGSVEDYRSERSIPSGSKDPIGAIAAPNTLQFAGGPVQLSSTKHFRLDQSAKFDSGNKAGQRSPNIQILG